MLVCMHDLTYANKKTFEVCSNKLFKLHLKMFCCYICDNKFPAELEAIQHLKSDHKIKNNKQKINCLINFNECGKTFLSFAALKKHHSSCRISYASEVRLSVSSVVQLNIKNIRFDLL